MTAIHHFWLSASPYSAVVVSGLFPAFAADGVATALALQGGNLVEMPRPVDGLRSSLGLSSGDLQTMLAGAQDLGAVAATLSLTSGSLAVGIQQTYFAESVTSGLVLESGSLYNGLISRDYELEAVSATFGLTGGTLT